MKKIIVLCCTLLSAISAFAYYGEYGSYSSHYDEMTGFEIFILIVCIAYIILSFVILVRWWKMTSNVDQIRQHLTHSNSDLTYLVAIGEKEQAQKAALKMLVDKLYPYYLYYSNNSKAEAMDKEIQSLLPKIQKLGLSIPDYVMTGKKFVDYMNNLTNRNDKDEAESNNLYFH